MAKHMPNNAQSILEFRTSLANFPIFMTFFPHVPSHTESSPSSPSLAVPVCQVLEKSQLRLLSRDSLIMSCE